MGDRESVERIRREPNERARIALTGSFLREKEGLVRHLSRKAANAEKTDLDLEDVLQAGRIGMLKAIDTWDADKGSLATWAGWKIKRCVQDAAHDAQPIGLPQIRGTTADRNRIVLAVRENPDVTAAELGIKTGMLERVRKTIGLRYVSVDMFGDADDAPAKQRKIERRMSDSSEQDDAEDVLDVRRMIEAVAAGVKSLARATGMKLEDAWTGLGMRLGCSPEVMPPPKPKKERPACPTPKITSTLTLRPLRLVKLRRSPLPRLARTVDESRKSPLRALPLPRLASPQRPLLRLRSLPSVAPISSDASRPSKLSRLSLPISARTSSDSSAALRSAA